MVELRREVREVGRRDAEVEAGGKASERTAPFAGNCCTRALRWGGTPCMHERGTCSPSRPLTLRRTGWGRAASACDPARRVRSQAPLVPERYAMRMLVR